MTDIQTNASDLIIPVPRYAIAMGHKRHVLAHSGAWTQT